MLRGDLQQGQRRAEVVVEVAARGQDRAPGPQDASQHLLDRGLAAGAGNGHDGFVEGRAVQRAELTEGQAAVAHYQLRQVDTGHFALDQGSYCALGLHVGQVVMTIEARTGQGDEQLTCANAAAVDADAGEAGIGARLARLQWRSQLTECHDFKHTEPPRRQGPSRLRPGRRNRGARH
ncbi:hypothetical protein D3C71_1725170 [compost metagenome]